MTSRSNGQDKDGDTASVALALQVKDDIPATSMAEPNAIVEDEEMTYGIDETDDATPDYTAQVTGDVSDNGHWRYRCELRSHIFSTAHQRLAR